MVVETPDSGAESDDWQDDPVVSTQAAAAQESHGKEQHEAGVDGASSDSTDGEVITISRACPVDWSVPPMAERTREGRMHVVVGQSGETVEREYVCGRTVLYELGLANYAGQLLRVFDLLESRVEVDECDDNTARITVQFPCIWSPYGSCDIHSTAVFIVETFDVAEAWVQGFQASMGAGTGSAFPVSSNAEPSLVLAPSNQQKRDGPDSSTKSGQLWTKSPGIISKWRQMWFELRNNILQEYDMAGGSPHGNPIHCKPAYGLVSKNKRAGPTFRFEMMSTDMFGAKVHLILGADSEYSAKSWIDALARSGQDVHSREAQRIRKPNAITRTRSHISSAESAVLLAGGVEMMSVTAMEHELSPPPNRESGNSELLGSRHDKPNLTDSTDSRSTGTDWSWTERANAPLASSGENPNSVKKEMQGSQQRALRKIGNNVRSSLRMIELHQTGVEVQPVEQLIQQLQELRKSSQLVSKLKAKAIEVEDFDTARACKKELESMQHVIAALTQAVREAGGIRTENDGLSLERMLQHVDSELSNISKSKAELDVRKAISIQEERYDEAGHIKKLEAAVAQREKEVADLREEICAVDALTVPLAELQRQKQEASARSDFETAMDLKDQHDALASKRAESFDLLKRHFALLEPTFCSVARMQNDSDDEALENAPLTKTHRRASSVTDARLATFLGWPLSRPAPSALARAGFTFSPTQQSPDRALCSSCQLEIAGWSATDVPALLHKQASPNCSLVASLANDITTPAGVDIPSTARILELVDELGAASEKFPIHAEINSVLSRPVEQTPVGGDLPRLCPSMTVTSTLGRRIAGETDLDLEGASAVRRVIVLTTLGLEGIERAVAVDKECSNYIPPKLHSESVPRGIVTLLQSSVLGNDCATTRILKGCTQAAIAPAVIALTQKVMLANPSVAFKDGDSWRLDLCLHHDPESGKPICAVLTHIKRQVQLVTGGESSPQFSFSWRLAMTFTADGILRHVDFGLEDLNFTLDASVELRACVKRSLAAHFERSSAPLTRDFFRSGFSRRSPAEEVELLQLTRDEEQVREEHLPTDAAAEDSTKQDSALPLRLKLKPALHAFPLKEHKDPFASSARFASSLGALRWPVGKSKK